MNAVSPRSALVGRWQDLDGRALIEAALADPHLGPVAAVTSFGADSAVLLHLLAEVDRHRPVVFLETGRHFPETLAYARDLTERLGLCDVRYIRPDPVALAALDPEETLASSDPERCCELRKRAPLGAALAGFGAWLTGRKRYQTTTRRDLPTVETDPASGRIKLNPLAPWSEDAVAAYREGHDLPEHPLVRFGFRSIGCAPCTRATRPGEDPRAGRWSGTGRVECGIHLADGAGI